MNNLIRTLTESQAKLFHPDLDLKLLLTTVKDGRRQSHDTKLSDPFYDSLEGLLLDLKTITIDNRDAEAFLKPVSKAEVPDYYDVISNPMDFQTMLKKVKQKHYKSKREFQDDLELIWSNCFTYNAAENHPLRQCVKRLKVKADRLLKYITDRKERTDPPIPIGVSPHHSPINGSNGLVNGHRRNSSYRSSSSSNTKNGTLSGKNSLGGRLGNRQRKLDVPFQDSLAITRTQEGMSAFMELERNIDRAEGTSSASTSSTTSHHAELMEQLQEYTQLFADDNDSGVDVKIEDENAMAVDGLVGEKRKLNGISDHRAKKRTRLSYPYPVPLPAEANQVSELWWSAVQSDNLLANGLPGIPFSAPSSSGYSQHPSSSSSGGKNHKPTGVGRVAKKKKKSARGHLGDVDVEMKSEAAGETVPMAKPTTTLELMNNNIKTMKRVRHTHAKFAALNVNSSAGNDDPDGGGIDGGGGASGSGIFGSGGGVGASLSVLTPFDDDAIGAVVDEKVDERPWKLKGKARGVEVGQKSADDCVRWMNGKVLEHVGFQGTSKVALDVMASVTSEYLLNVGRTIRYMCDKYSNTMTPEEIILHTLFESGSSKIQDLERYISDDVERYGARLGDLEKKLVSAYRESAAVETLEDEGLFDEEDEEDTGALAIGDFADALGEDYLGLRELGIAAEFGMSSLSIPKRLLKGKKAANNLASAPKPTEPPLPYPPPPPFIPLNSHKIDDQIGLLKVYYTSRVNALLGPSAHSSLLPPPPPPPLPLPSSQYVPPPLQGPTMPPGPGQQQSAGPGSGSIPLPIPPQEQTQEQGETTPLPLPMVILPDDVPTQAQMKMGPLGQIVKGGPSGGQGKKKAKVVASGAIPPPPLAAGAGAGGPGVTSGGAIVASGSVGSVSGGGVGGGGGMMMAMSTSSGSGSGSGDSAGAAMGVGMGVIPPPQPKKKKGATGVGTGNGRKKKLVDGQIVALGNGPPPSSNGGQQQPQSQSQSQQQQQQLPPVVSASA